jgi:ABC-type Na+ efflux pump permease subunit
MGRFSALAQKGLVPTDCRKPRDPGAQMLKTIIRLEWQLRARRDQFRPFLSCYVACLLLDCCAWYYWALAIFLPPSPGRSGQFLTAAVELVWLQQWLLPFLVAPPFIATAFATEKAKGVLPLLFTTPVTSGEIVLGKLIGRIAPLALLSIAHWPFWGLLAALVGINSLSAAVLAGASLLPLLAVSAVSLLASASCRKSADAVLGVYFLLGAGILGISVLDNVGSSGVPSWARLLVFENGLCRIGPDYLLEPVWDGRAGALEVSRRALIATAAWGLIVVVCLTLACWRLQVAGRDRSRVRRSRLCLRRPPVSDEPICWKECYRERRMPLGILRHIPPSFALPGVFVGTGGLLLWCLWPAGISFAEFVEWLRIGDFQTLSEQLRRNGHPGRPALMLAMLIGVLFLAALSVGVRCATAISAEREEHTWELLLLAPLSTRDLIHGKVEGALRSTRPYLVACALSTLPLAWLFGPAEVMLTLAILLLAEPILSVASAVGIDQSARAANSWRSILATVRLIVGGTFVTAFVLNFALGCLGLIFLGLGDFFEILRSYFPLLDWLGIERRYHRLVYFLLVVGSFTWILLRQASREYRTKAEKWIDTFERAPDPEKTQQRTERRVH